MAEQTSAGRGLTMVGDKSGALVPMAHKPLADFARHSAVVLEQIRRMWPTFRADDVQDFRQLWDGQAVFRTDPERDGQAWVVWFGEQYGSVESHHIGTPTDYAAIRSDYDALKRFIADKLKIGPLPWGDKMCEGVATPSLYIAWLYRHSDNPEFRGNLERAVYEMLEYELRAARTPLADFEQEFGTATETAKFRWSSQFILLVGLLEVVEFAGRRDNGFARTYPLLREAATTNFMRDAPELVHTCAIKTSTVYGNVLTAIAAVQPVGELDGFWLENIRSADPHFSSPSIWALFRGHPTTTERRALLSAIIEAISERPDDREMGLGAQGIQLQQLAYAISYDVRSLNSCFDGPGGESRWAWADTENFAIWVLDGSAISGAQTTFTFVRITAEGETKIQATYDAQTGGVTAEDAAMRPAMGSVMHQYLASQPQN